MRIARIAASDSRALPLGKEIRHAETEGVGSDFAATEDERRARAARRGSTAAQQLRSQAKLASE
jgi:hypothetical protein